MSCINEMPNNSVGVGNKGDEVKFSAGLGNSETKTIYDYTDITNPEAESVKVIWKVMDSISVFGTAALDGRKEGLYRVESVETVNGLSYANSLLMLGEHGVQWDKNSSDFYAVYPSLGKDKHFELSQDKRSVTVPVSINTRQDNLFTFDVRQNKWVGIQAKEANGEWVENMSDALMYAYSKDVAAGSSVTLQFTPFSTVLKFTLDGVQTPSGLSNVYINEIEVTAPDANNNPTYVAGAFPLTITGGNNPSVQAGEMNAGTASNKVAIKMHSIYVNEAGESVKVNNIQVKPGQKIEFCVFVAPSATVSLNGWKVKLLTSHGNKTFTINASTNNQAKLLAGQIHPVRIPALKSLKDDFTFSSDSWISQLPPTVYLSEISLPGSWYSTDDEHPYQSNTDLSAQYKAGIRAFNIDCRLTMAVGLKNTDYGDPSAGFTNAKHYQYYDQFKHATDENVLVLACAGTEEDDVSEVIGTAKVTKIGKSVEAALIELGEIIALNENQDEFIEVILTVAEKPKTRNTLISAVNPIGSTQVIYGTVNPQMVLAAIAKTLKKPAVSKYLYNDHIDDKTTIQNVLGKIVVKVNMNTSNSNIIKYAQGWRESNPTAKEEDNIFYAPMMLSSGSMASDSQYITGDILKGTFNTYTSPDMICGKDYKIGTLKYYNHQANNTGGSNQPTIQNRKDAVDALLGIASTNHTNNVKAWYQIGIGGVQDNNYTTIATTMNKYTYQAIMRKMGYSFNGDNLVTEIVSNEDGTTSTVPVINESNQDISPVGIILMNQCLNESCYGPQLIDAILKLNARFYMERAEDTGTSTSVAVDNWGVEIL